jgi:hypothetical protein
MEERGTPVQRWQKPFANLTEAQAQSNPITLLRVYSNLRNQGYYYKTIEEDWVKRGNTLIVLGTYQPASNAEFTTLQDWEGGTIKIETRRRKRIAAGEKTLLGDEFGAIVWSQEIGRGKIIFASSPYLGANAYQDYPANYEFLAQLMAQTGTPIWVDEYIHGYKDTEVIEEEVGENIFSYFAKTPLMLVLIQGLIVLVIVLWAENRRFGPVITVSPPKVNNSRAYIQALAAVLRKAEQKEFLMQTINEEAQKNLQTRLGLGKTPLESHTLAVAWAQETGQAAKELETLIKTGSQKRRLKDVELVAWLEKWHNINSQLKIRSQGSRSSQTPRMNAGA